jgi:hypothetical protein
MNHPPKPPLAFRIGIVGHRPNRLKEADFPLLRKQVVSLLEEIRAAVGQFGSANRDLYADQPPVLRVVSPLAEGSDRLVAEQAIRLGYELSCPMPFFHEEFEKDFTGERSMEPDSLARFRELLSMAEKETALVTFEQQGSREEENEAYRTNAGIVLNQSDLLFIIWDGRYLDKPGGTEETFLSARTRQIPVIWIDACAPHYWEIVRPGQSMPARKSKERHQPKPEGDLGEIRQLVQGILDVPPGTGADEDRYEIRLLEYYHEKPPRRNYALLWKFFRNLLGSNKLKLFSPAIRDTDLVPPEHPVGAVRPPAANSDEWIRPFYAWSDKLAEKYSDRYRSGFILTYLLSSVAVGLALFPLITGWLSSGHHPAGLLVFMMLEAVVIITILGLVFVARNRRWHGRWLDYRMLAESVRQLRLFLPLGGGKPFPKVAAHLKEYGNPSATWMTWYVQAIERYAGLPSGKADKRHLGECLRQYTRLLEEQLTYHQYNTLIYSRIEKRLHSTGEATLWLTLLACLAHLVPVMLPFITFPTILANTLTFLCGFLPALGASMAGINHQGEFRRIAKSSGAMAEQFAELAGEANRLASSLENEPGDRPSFSEITDLSRDTANLMVNEVTDWKVVYQDRPPVLPA